MNMSRISTKLSLTSLNSLSSVSLKTIASAHLENPRCIDSKIGKLYIYFLRYFLTYFTNYIYFARQIYITGLEPKRSIKVI